MMSNSSDMFQIFSIWNSNRSPICSTVKEIMSRAVVSVNENDSIEKMLLLFRKYHFHTYPVVTDCGELVGIIDQDIILEILMSDRIPRLKYTHLTAVRTLGECAREIMMPHPVTISLDASLFEAADLMLKHHLNRICVVEDGKLLGIISKLDIINEAYKRHGLG